MRITANRIVRTALFLLALISLPSFKIMAQTFPPFTAPSSQQDTVQMDAGVSAAQVPNGMYTTALMSVYSYETNLYYSISAGGLNSSYSTPAGGDLPLVDCDANIPGACSAAIAVFNGNIYIAYPDQSTGGLDVVQATVVPGNIGYSVSLVHQDTSVSLTTTPSMVVFNNQLIIIFGAKTSSLNNAFYSVNYTGGSWPTATEEYLGGSTLGVASPSKPGLSVLNNVLWMCSQQNNTDRNLFVYSSTDGVHWDFVEEDTGLQMGGGASMVTINNNLVLANQQIQIVRYLYSVVQMVRLGRLKNILACC